MKMGPIMAWLEEVLPEDVIIANGAGNFATWMHTVSIASAGSTRRPHRPPARWATASRRRCREADVSRPRRGRLGRRRRLLMNGQEFATAIQYDAPIVVVILNNGIYGTIRMHQERDYPGRVSGTRPSTRTSPHSPARSAPWRDGGNDGGVRSRLRARSRLRQTGDHRRASRSRGHYADADPDADP